MTPVLILCEVEHCKFNQEKNCNATILTIVSVYTSLSSEGKLISNPVCKRYGKKETVK